MAEHWYAIIGNAVPDAGAPDGVITESMLPRMWHDRVVVCVTRTANEVPHVVGRIVELTPEAAAAIEDGMRRGWVYVKVVDGEGGAEVARYVGVERA